MPSERRLDTVRVQLHTTHGIDDLDRSSARSTQLEELHVLSEALQRSSAQGNDVNLELTQLTAHGLGDEELVALGSGGNPGREVHAGSYVVALTVEHRAHMGADGESRKARL